MTSQQHIKVMLNNREITCDAFSSEDTLLDFLRLEQGLRGTKEGCAEGDCGACTVLVGRLLQGKLRYEAVNSCIRFLATLNGCHLVTIEHLSGANGALHPIQQAMFEFNGSQCGFCTPGVIMSLYALWMNTPNPTDHEIETALQGNLCRCTGYEPIIKAARAISEYGTPTHDLLVKERAANTQKLEALSRTGPIIVEHEGSVSLLPSNTDEFANFLLEYPDATIVAGATDAGLWVTKFLRPLSPAIFIGNLNDLKSIKREKAMLTIGAGVTYSEGQEAIIEAFPHLKELWDRIAGCQVRNMGTIGGNIANGSPIGDTPPVLIALGASVVLRKGNERRKIMVEDFFIDYGKQDLAKSEFLEAIEIPISATDKHAAYKISKRRDEDISSVCAAFNVTVEDNLVTSARIAFGGMAATPKRAIAAENALIGQLYNEASFVTAAQKLGDDFTPLTDMRASADYRMTVAQNLFRRFILEDVKEQQVRLIQD